MNVPFPPPSSSNRSASDAAAANGKNKPAKVRPRSALSPVGLGAWADASGAPAQTYPAFDLHSFLHEQQREPAAAPVDGDTEMA